MDSPPVFDQPIEDIEKVSARVATLLVVDVQNDFCHRDGTMAEAGRDLGAVDPMISRLEILLRAARWSSVPVVWVRTTHDDVTNTAVWLARQSPTMAARVRPKSNCWTGTWGAEFYRVGPVADEPVVTKHRYSAFAGTSLDWVLRSLGRRSLLVTGVSTEACVESTVRDGLFHDYHVTLVEDCCASYSTTAHEASVTNVRNLFGQVVRGDEVIARWREETVPAPVDSVM